MVRHFSVSLKLKKLQNVSSKCQISSNRMISLKSDLSAISKLVRHFSVSLKLKKLHAVSVYKKRWLEMSVGVS